MLVGLREENVFEAMLRVMMDDDIQLLKLGAQKLTLRPNRVLTQETKVNIKVRQRFTGKNSKVREPSY